MIETLVGSWDISELVLVVWPSTLAGQDNVKLIHKKIMI